MGRRELLLSGSVRVPLGANLLFFAAFSVSGCATNLPTPSWSGAAAPSAGAGWRYEVLVDHGSGGALELAADALFPAGSEPTLTLDKGAMAFVKDLRVSRNGSRWVSIAVAPGRETIDVPACAEGCRVRYRFALGEAAASIDDVDRAMKVDEDAVEAPASTWLLHPTRAPVGETFRVHVTTAEGVSFASGVDAVASDTYEADVMGLAKGPYAIFGEHLRIDRRAIAGADVRVVEPDGAFDDLSRDAIARWVDASARAVGGYFGRFPVRQVLVLLVPEDTGPARVQSGRTMGNGGAAIVVRIGRRANDAALVDDWVLPHEMVHLALPSVEKPHHWLEEGVATYVERIARARAGSTSEEDVWRDLFYGLPKGLPARGDRGLDHTPTWGRTYWGGALFCMLADLEIRERTQGRSSLRDALSAIVAAGGNIGVAWPLERTLDVADRATGVTVLHDLYAEMAERPVKVDLAALWQRLGVTVEGAAVQLDDDAPVAETRKAITRL